MFFKGPIKTVSCIIIIKLFKLELYTFVGYTGSNEFSFSK